MLRDFPAKAVFIFIGAAAFAVMAAATTAQAGNLQILYSFCSDRDPESGICHDGTSPAGPVVRDAAGNLFGTTQRGGKFDQGTVFEISGTTHTILYSFCAATNCNDGAVPLAGLVMDTEGNLYGTTQNGGPASSGVAFELKHVAGGWKQTVLHEFCSKPQCADGGDVVAGLTIDDAGNLYGTTLSGGLGASEGNSGTVFELTRNMTSGKWSEHVLYAFCSLSNCTDGIFPNAGVIRDAKGNIYGTTTGGGQNSGGTVYELSQNATTKKWTEKVLYNFCSIENCTDGAGSVATPTMDKSGNLFGTTQVGGAGSGVVFKLTFKHSTGKYAFNLLYTFCQANTSDCGDGVHPQAGVLLDKSGNLYGTTSSTFATGRFNLGGTVYRLTPSGKESLLVSFCGSVCKSGFSNGTTPGAAVITDGAGNLYGTTELGGRNGVGGEVFEVPK